MNSVEPTYETPMCDGRESLSDIATHDCLKKKG